MLEDNSREELKKLVGSEKLEICDVICEYIADTYNLESIFNEINRKSTEYKYELKFVKGRKKFCGLYFAPDGLGLLIIFGKTERTKVENVREQLSDKLLKLYDEEKTYHDGKWLMLELEDLSLLEDIKKLLLVKRKPDK